MGCGVSVQVSGSTSTEAGVQWVQTIKCGVSGKSKWNGIAACNGKLYCSPCYDSSVLVINPATNSVQTIECGVSGDERDFLIDGKPHCRWSGIAECNGKLYCAPSEGSYVLVIDPATNSVQTIKCGGPLLHGYGQKWNGIAACNGKLYCAPFNASSVLVIDPATNSVQTIKCGVSGYDNSLHQLHLQKWSGIAECNGKLYCSPYDASSVLVIDPATNSLQFIETPLDLGDLINPGGNSKWNGIALCNGKLYCAPYDVVDSSVLVIDPATNSVQTIEWNGPTEWNSFKWNGIAACNGKLYCSPCNALSVLVINPATNSMQKIDFSAPVMGPQTNYGAFSGIAECNGKLYCAPYNASSVIAVHTLSAMLSALSPSLTSTQVQSRIQTDALTRLCQVVVCNVDKPDDATWGRVVDCMPAVITEESQCTLQPEQLVNQSGANHQQCCVSALLSVEKYIESLKQGDSIQVQVQTLSGHMAALRVWPAFTVRVLKQILVDQDVDSAAVERAITLSGHQLEDNQSMQAVGVVDGSVLEILKPDNYEEPVPKDGGFCAACGTSLVSSDQFCAECGAAAMAAAPPPPVVQGARIAMVPFGESPYKAGFY